MLATAVVLGIGLKKNIFGNKWIEHSDFCFWGQIASLLDMQKVGSPWQRIYKSPFLNMASLGFIGPPLKFLVPPWYQSSRYLLNLSSRTFSYFGPLYQYLCNTPDTGIALKQFDLLPSNTLFWSNFIYYPLTHQFEAITLGWIKTCVKWFWDNS